MTTQLLSFKAEELSATEEEKAYYRIRITGDGEVVTKEEATFYLTYKQMKFLRDSLSTLIQQQPEAYRKSLK